MQFTQADAPSPVPYWPIPHCRQAEEAFVAVNVPRWHQKQLDMPPREKDPAVHSRHVVATSSEYLPGVHVEHRDAPGTPLKVPAMHDLHILSVASNALPATHWRQLRAPPREYQPSSQALQVVAPSKAENVSGGQRSHAVLGLPPENVPAAHNRHPLELCAVEYVPGSQSVHSNALASE